MPHLLKTLEINTALNDPQVERRIGGLVTAMSSRHLGIVCAPDSRGVREIRCNDEDRDAVTALIDEHGFTLVQEHKLALAS